MALPNLSSPAVPLRNRNVVIAGSVVLFHVAALWALQTGLLRRAIEIIVPVEILAEVITPPTPKVEPPPPAPKPDPVRQPVVKKTAPAPPPAPRPAAIADPTPAPAAPIVPAPQPPPPPTPAPVAVAPAPPPPRIELPSTNADYLQNPKPAYPPISKRLGEQGKVVHSVLIGADGIPISAKLVQSSGFSRLDEAAYAAVMRWRYVPGKRNGVAEAMSFQVPINWVLD